LGKKGGKTGETREVEGPQYNRGATPLSTRGLEQRKNLLASVKKKRCVEKRGSATSELKVTVFKVPAPTYHYGDAKGGKNGASNCIEETTQGKVKPSEARPAEWRLSWGFLKRSGGRVEKSHNRAWGGESWTEDYNERGKRGKLG